MSPWSMHWCILDTLVQRVRTCHQRVEHIVSPSPPANPREGRQGSIGTAGAGLSYTACCKNGGYELPPYVLEALGQPPEYSGFDGGAAVVQPAGRCALRMPPETPLDLRSSCRRAGFHRSPQSTCPLCAPIKPAVMNTAAATTRHKDGASALPPPSPFQPTSIANGWSVPMKPTMLRHHWRSATAAGPVCRTTTPAAHEQGREEERVNQKRLFRPSKQEGLHLPRSAACRCEAKYRLACQVRHWAAVACQGAIPRVFVVVQRGRSASPKREGR